MVLVFPTEIARVSLHNGRLICAGTCFAGLVLHCCNVVGFLIGDFGTGVEGWGLVHNCAVGMSLCSSRDHVEAACSVCKRARDEYFVGHGGGGGVVITKHVFAGMEKVRVQPAANLRGSVGEGGSLCLCGSSRSVMAKPLVISEEQLPT